MAQGAVVGMRDSPIAQEDRTMATATQYKIQSIGALPAIARDFERLDLAATIDRIVPWEGEVPPGTLVEVLIASRLLRPKALFRVGEWARSAEVTDSYDLTVE